MHELRLSADPVPLGATGIMVSSLAWGMWRFKGTDVARATALVTAALDAGITLFDTADIYGPDNGEGFGASEALLGRVFAADPGLRQRMVLATKGGIRMGVPYDSSAAYIEQAVDASLQRLGVDHVDLWQIHRPDLLAHPAETAAALDRIVASGRARAVGVSNFTPAQVAALVSFLETPLASIQPEFSALAWHPLFDGRLDQAMQMRLAVLAWSPLGQGRLGHGPDEAPIDTLDVARVLARIAHEQGVSPAAVAYAFVGAHPARPIPIVGTQRPSRIAEARQALKVSFTRESWYEVLQAAMGQRLP
jgi:predicted oxidoreductase